MTPQIPPAAALLLPCLEQDTCTASFQVSQRSRHRAPIFRLFLGKIAVNGTRQCDFPIFAELPAPTGVSKNMSAGAHAALGRQTNPRKPAFGHAKFSRSTRTHTHTHSLFFFHQVMVGDSSQTSHLSRNSGTNDSIGDS